MNAITKYSQTRELLRGAEAKMRFEEILGDKDKAQAFLASVLSVVYQSNGLSRCDPQSIMFAAMKAATLDLPVEPNLGQSYIIPYKEHATFQIGYKGIIQLALRTQQYLIINATEVYEGEQIKQNRLTGVIVLNGQKKSDKIIGYASYFKMKSGYEHYLYMSVEELTAFAKKYSKAYRVDDSLWHTDFDVMAKKTVLKQNLTKYGELRISTILEAAMEADEDVAETVDAVAIPVPEPPEPEKKPRKPKEEKVEEQASETPFVQEATSSGVSSDPPEPEGPPMNGHVSTPATLSTPEMLVQGGYFREVGLAKAALMWYKGSLEYEPLIAWANQVQDAMKKGAPLAQAAKQAKQ